MIPSKLRPWIALGATGALILLALGLPPDGVERGPALISIMGKWHLLALHIPAALLLLIPLAELVLREPKPSRTLRLMGDFAAVGTWMAAVLGIFHAHFNGYEGQGIQDHLWLGVGCAALAAAAWWLMEAAFVTRVAVQVAAALAVGAAGHVGGELVHGEGFLTRASGAKRGETVDVSVDLAAMTPAELRLYVYETRVKPLLAENCVSCHDDKKQKGKLRMDSIAALEKGGSEGPALVWGKSAESLIVVRSSLPRDDDESMPPDPKEMLTKEEVDILRSWIDGIAPVPAAVPVAPPIKKVAQAPAKFPSNQELRKVAEKLVTTEGLTAVPRALDSNAGLVIAAHAVAARFDDAAFLRLAASGSAVAELDLSRTKVTEASAVHLAKFPNLEVLVLNETEVGDAFAKAAATLPRLERLAMRSSKLTDAGLSALAQSPMLGSLFVGQTAATAQGLGTLRAAKPQLRLFTDIALESKTAAAPPDKAEMQARANAVK